MHFRFPSYQVSFISIVQRCIVLFILLFLASKFQIHKENWSGICIFVKKK